MYLRFLIDHRRLLTFGLLTAVLSGFGQAFYIGLFNNELRATFGLTHGGLGLVSGATIILAAGCALLAGTTALAGLSLALFLLRAFHSPKRYFRCLRYCCLPSWAGGASGGWARWPCRCCS